MIDPVWSYPRGLDPQVPCVAVVGGFVYQGEGLDGIDGAYLATDLCLGYFWALRQQPGGAVDIAQIGVSPLGPGGTNADARISSFIAGPDGEPYVVLNSGAELWKMVPASQVAQPGPVQDDRPPTVVFAEDGVAEFFQRSCAACHGASREGDLGPALLPSTLTQPDAFYSETIAGGREGTAMPSWRAQGLTDDQISELVTFLKTTQP
jgi:mono/diheme cytochrome c family protein